MALIWTRGAETERPRALASRLLLRILRGAGDGAAGGLGIPAKAGDRVARRDQKRGGRGGQDDEFAHVTLLFGRAAYVVRVAPPVKLQSQLTACGSAPPNDHADEDAPARRDDENLAWRQALDLGDQGRVEGGGVQLAGLPAEGDVGALQQVLDLVQCLQRL